MFSPSPPRTSLNRFTCIFKCCWKSTLVTRLCLRAGRHADVSWQREWWNSKRQSGVEFWPCGSDLQTSVFQFTSLIKKQWSMKNIAWVIRISAGPRGRAVLSVGLWPLACWDYRFEYRRGHVRLSLVKILCCQVDISATGWFLVQGSPT